MNKFYKEIHKGFTLIELLIVIAVLGVLAAVVLVAIDPIDQIARAEDAGRKSTVGQLAAAMQAYIVGQALPAAPTPTANSWQTMLVQGGEIKSAFQAPAGPQCTGPAANLQTGYCYAPNGAAGNFFIWTFVESKSEIDKAEGSEGAGAAGTTTDPDQICNAGAAAYLYDSAQGRGGNACLVNGNVPPANTPLF